MTGMYKFDGLDMYDTYRYSVESGSNDFIGLPKSKEVEVFDWKDQNGKEYWLSQRFFDDKEATLMGHITASGFADFWARRDALWNALKAPGVHELFINELQRTFNVFYIDNPNPERYSRLLVGEPIIKMPLTFKVLI